MEPMYRGIPFSPQTVLTDSIGAADTIIPVDDVSVFPDAPNYATIGTDTDGETILYAAKAAGALSGCTRGVEGAAKAWGSGTIIARNYTAKDMESLQKNVEDHDTALLTKYSAENTPPYPVKSVNGKTGAVSLSAADVGALPSSTKIPAKTSDLTNDSGFIVDYTETDPTVPAWAKAASKPSYTADEVGALPKSTPIPSVVQSTGNSTAAVMSQAAVTNALNTLSNEKADQSDLDDLKAQGVQQTPAYPEGETAEECLEWLAENGDQSKVYLLPDGMLYAWRLTEVEVDGGPAYTNRLPLATDTDRATIYGGDYNGDGENDGYITGYRLSSSGSLSALTNACASGFIPAVEGDVLRIKGTLPIAASTANYLVTYDSSNAKIGNQTLLKNSDLSDWSSMTRDWWNYADGIITITLSAEFFGTGFNAIRFSAGTISSDAIVTVNEEIKEGGGTTIVTEYAWASTGRAFTPADYEDRIIDLEEQTAENTADIAKLLSGVVDIGDDLAYIRQWDSPIYDKTPVWELSTEKAALTSADKTVAAVYAKYDALMAEHPDFITRTDLGLCSDGATHVYRYDFRERESRHQSGFDWSETKPKFIVVTGIHREWNGIYSMYNALAEIAANSELAELRRNVHFIVVPVLNPYSISGPYATVGHAANYNGVEIHRNFEVGFTVAGEGTIHYSGETALSEVESQYLDDILKANTDAAYFLTCHSFDRDKTWGVGFLWGSSATKYMCNMAFRVIDKMGKAWHEKYGTTWEEGIKAQNDNLLENIATYPNATALDEGDYRIGHAALTDTPGCEQRQATKYGIQATNFEVGETMFVLDDTMLSAKALTHGTEAYVNFFLTAMGCYDYKNRKDYAPNLPLSE